MSNELNNIIAHNTDGVREGIAIGGDRYPGSVYIDHLMRYEQDPDVKMMVMLGEVSDGQWSRACTQHRLVAHLSTMLWKRCALANCANH